MLATLHRPTLTTALLAVAALMLTLSVGVTAATPDSEAAKQAETGATSALATPPLSVLSPRELVPLLSRSGVAPDLTQIEIIFAPPLLFDATGMTQPDEMTAQPTLAFILQETVHEGALPAGIPGVYMLLPEGERVAPYSAQITADDQHHRTSRLYFPRPVDWSMRTNKDGEAVLTLIIPEADGSFSVQSTFEWPVPVGTGD